MKNIRIKFLGAAGTVTGSKFLVQADEKTILVDCGMFQGLKKLRLLNWEKLAVEPATIDFVLLTHGHLDHTGYLPRLVKDGFTNPIYATHPTMEVTKVILQDSARIQEEDAKRANENHNSRHQPAVPLYDLKDVEKTLPLIVPQKTDIWIQLSEHISCRFRYNGHIIGATFIELKTFDKLLVFSGDIGRVQDPLMYPPDKPEQADILFIESTYGDRLHPENSEKSFENIINEAVIKNGPIIIPGFAVERIQLLMYLIWKLQVNDQIPEIPVYMDSPMGRETLNIFHHYQEWHKLSLEDYYKMCRGIKMIKTIQDSEHLAGEQDCKIIIAGSGMASGGRVLTYFQHHLENPAATILLVGFQAEGTRGRQLLEGANEIKLYGTHYKVKASIKNITSLSAHADQKGLLDWMSELKKQPSKIFIVHGEPHASDTLRVKIKDTYGWESEIPALNDSFEVNNI